MSDEQVKLSMTPEWAAALIHSVEEAKAHGSLPPEKARELGFLLPLEDPERGQRVKHILFPVEPHSSFIFPELRALFGVIDTEQQATRIPSVPREVLNYAVNLEDDNEVAKVLSTLPVTWVTTPLDPAQAEFLRDFNWRLPPLALT